MKLLTLIFAAAASILLVACSQQQQTTPQTAMPGGPVCLGAQLNANGTCSPTQYSIGAPITPVAAASYGTAAPNYNPVRPLVGVANKPAANQAANKDMKSADADSQPSVAVSASSSYTTAANLETSDGVPLPSAEPYTYTPHVDAASARGPASVSPETAPASSGPGAANQDTIR